MFAGHIGAALAIGRAERRVNVGVFVAAALLLDLLLWLFVLLGFESVTIPADFVSTHQARFLFPYSHGLAASVIWSGCAALAALVGYSRLQTRWRAALWVAAAVFSHWVLDGAVHRRELRLAGPASQAVGLGLWDNMPAALTLEAAIVVAGLYVFVSHTTLARGKAVALTLLTLLVMTFTAIGMTIAPAPPSATAMAGSSLVTLVAVCALAVWLGRLPRTS